MASPMNILDACGLCWDRLDGGTFDLDDDGETASLLLVNVCSTCRWWETRQMILMRANWVTPA